MNNWLILEIIGTVLGKICLQITYVLEKTTGEIKSAVFVGNGAKQCYVLHGITSVTNKLFWIGLISHLSLA